MNYWITAHWPPHDTDFEGAYCGVWIQNGKEHAAAQLKKGDLIFKYESRTGPSRKVVLPDGRTINQACRSGRMGVIALMEATSDLYDKHPEPTEYTDGSQRWWRYFADAVSKDEDGFVSLAKLNRLLGYKES